MSPRRFPALVVFGPLALYIGTLLVLAAVYLHPPLLGWIGLAVAATVGITAAAIATRLFPRSEVSGERVHPHRDGHIHLLVVLDAELDRASLAGAVRSRVAGRHADVLVVAPVLASPLHFLADDEGGEEDAARDRLAVALGELAAASIAARGELGGDDPMQAIGDALGHFPADEIVLVTREPSRRNWLEQGLERRVRDAFGVHVSLVLGRDRSRGTETALRTV